MEACNELQQYKRKPTSNDLSQLPKKRKIHPSNTAECVRVIPTQTKLSAWRDLKRLEQSESHWPAIFDNDGPPVVVQASVPSTPGKASVIDLITDREENTSEVRRLRDTIEDLENQVQTLRQAVESADLCHRALRSQLQSLKGPIKVLCRLKPATSASRLSITFPEAAFHTGGVLHTLSADFGHSVVDFTCDGVLPETCAQEAVFSEIAEYVETVLAGEALTVFVYGATGTGKSFTLEGNWTGESAQMGVIERMANALFANVTENVHVRISCLYIANDVLQDLVAPQSQKMNIKIGPWGIGVDLLSWYDVDCPERLMEVVKAAKDRRAGDTRGHTLYQIILDGTLPSGRTLFSRVNFVELAGSECRSASLSEAKFLHTSFSCLRRVISSKMGCAQKHSVLVPPYRESKLTRVLQDSLSPDSARVVVIATVATAEESALETRETLKFGTELQRCVV